MWLFKQCSNSFTNRCIEIIGSVINSFIQDANEATGFSFTIMGGGLDKEGNIKMCMCIVRSIFLLHCSNFLDRSSVGKTSSGKNFMSTHKDWEEAVNKPFKEFLCLRHRKLYFFGLVLSPANLAL
jgi:hypothetical protein